MLSKRNFCISFLVMLAFSFFSFCNVAAENFGKEMTQVFSADACFMGDEYLSTFSFFLYIFSFIVVVPHAMSYIGDLETGVYSLVVLRIGKVRYLFSKMIATFFGNFIIIAVPFVFNLILCHLTFSHQPNYYFGEYGMPNYTNMILGTAYAFSAEHTEISFFKIFLESPTLYNLLHILILSIVSGFLGVLLLCFSFIFNRRRAYMFAPVYLLMRASSVVTEYIYARAISDPDVLFVNYNIMSYLAVFGYPGKSVTYIVVLVVLGILFAVFSTLKAIKTDYLLVIAHEKE